MGSPLLKWTFKDFLKWENEQPDKHEFHRGEVFAMVGARRVHGCVVSNLSRSLGNSLRGSPCRVFSEGTFTIICQPGLDGVNPCPCGNAPSFAHRGCDNSGNTGGARLTPAGDTTPTR